MLTIRGRLITPFVLGSMSVGLNILIRHSFMDLWVWITALVPWQQLHWVVYDPNGESNYRGGVGGGGGYGSQDAERLCSRARWSVTWMMPTEPLAAIECSAYDGQTDWCACCADWSLTLLSSIIVVPFLETCFKYGKISVTRTPMACSSCLIRTRFWVSRSSSMNPRKQIFRDVLGDFSYFVIKVYVECTH